MNQMENEMNCLAKTISTFGISLILMTMTHTYIQALDET